MSTTKFKVFDPESAGPAPYEIGLNQDGPDTIQVVLIDPDTGERAPAGRLLKISPRGVARYRNVTTSERNPLRDLLDSQGRLVGSLS